jgi:proteasome lid subunit RPN8/RPN11
MALRMQRTHLEQLRRHGEQSYPQECCGVLVGEFDPAGGRKVRGVLCCGNAHADSPQNRYEIAPAELVRIQCEARLAGHEIVGFYHSHPDWPARWSGTDLAEAHWTGCSYVITSVEAGRASATSSFVLRGTEDGKHFEEEEIEVESSKR